MAQSDDAAALARKLSNPIASLISLPFQLNYDSGYGAAGNGSRLLMNVQPVIPFKLNENWNVISRTIVPFDNRDFNNTGYSFAIGDIVQSFFFSPSEPSSSGVTWGVGPVFVLPSGSNFSGDTWGAGLTGVVLKQSGRSTYGMLANHIWDVSGPASIDATFIQPFASYTTPELWTYGINVEGTYDWNTSQWSAPLNVSATKLIDIDGQKISIGGGVGYWLASPNGQADGWRARLIATFLFPK
ncbi:transporter [Pseudohalocynthiibacter aestuariivivens]|nr:transporter [Pseudohalocynthiibacter aestuariivivens]